MRRTGMLLFRNAFVESLQGVKPMCVVHTANAAEILLKARIAQEHPLLIFSKPPKADYSKSNPTLIDLLENGRTYSYEELPDQLWATTGIKIDRLEQYRKFGKLRNQIVHFSMANADKLDVLALSYSHEVLDPLVESFWGKSVIDFITKDPDYDDFVGSGLFEDSIRRVFTIDQRLRRLLGDSSREAWETMNAYLEATESSDEAKTPEDWQAECEDWEDSQAGYDNDAQYIQKIKDKVSWKIFLDSF